MGIELLDLTFRIEKEFKIKIDRDDLMNLLQHGNRTSPPSNAWTDIQVADFLRLVEYTIMRQHVTPEPNVFQRVRKHIAETMDVEESEVTQSSWLARDLWGG